MNLLCRIGIHRWGAIVEEREYVNVGKYVRAYYPDYYQPCAKCMARKMAFRGSQVIE